MNGAKDMKIKEDKILELETEAGIETGVDVDIFLHINVKEYSDFEHLKLNDRRILG